MTLTFKKRPKTLFTLLILLQLVLTIKTNYHTPTSKVCHEHHNINFIIASVLSSETYAQKLYKQSIYYRKHCNQSGLLLDGLSSHAISTSHATALRILLIIGGIEPNPGPVNLQEQSKPLLGAILILLRSHVADFKRPLHKDDIIKELSTENPAAVELAYTQIQNNQTKGLATHHVTTTTDAEPCGRTIKLPELYAKDTRIWFEQIEQILQGASEAVKKSSLLRVLPTNVIFDSGAKVSDDFTTINASLIAYFADSADRQLRQLLEEQHLGDRKPSAALRKLQRLAPNNDNLVRLRFMEILPEPIRVTLASIDGISLEKLADTADRMLEQMPKMSVRQASEQPSTSEWQADVNQKIDSLTLAVQALTHDTRQRSSRSMDRQHSPSRSRSRSFSRSFNPNGDWCWYHANFGQNARKCNQPCKWTSNRSSRPSSPTFTSPGNDNSPSM